MKRKWVKWIGIALLIPIILIILVVVLIYIPPVQNFLQRRVTAYISESTGMDISIDHINLRFPLDLVAKDVQVIQAPDTILALESMGLKVRLRPLFRGDIEAHGVFLENARVNTANIMPQMQLRGQLARFYLDTRVINLSQQLVDLETAELNDAVLHLTMNDTIIAPTDTTESAMNWRIQLPNLEISNVSLTMEVPADTMNVAAYINSGQVSDVLADLGLQLYKIQNISINGTRVNYDQGTSPPVAGLDPSHIDLRNINIEVDSILYRAQEMAAVIRNFTLDERSGLSVTSMSGRLYADSTMLRVPQFNLQTPNSEMNFTARTYWQPQTAFQIDRLEARLNARLGKQDVMLFAGDMPASFQRDYPSRPLVVQLAADGTMDNLQISRLTADLPGAFNLSGNGQLVQITDSINRSADINLQMQTQRLDFLLSLAGVPRDGSIVIPPISMDAGIQMRGPQIAANLQACESQGLVALNGSYNLNTEAYTADLSIDSLQINHFMPRDSIYSLSANASVTGRGMDFNSTRTTASLTAAVDMLEYGRYQITGIDLTAELKNALATAHLTSMNPLLVMDAWGEYRMNTRYMDARASVNVADVDIYQLGLIDRPMRNTLSVSLSAEAKQDSVNLFVVSGDLEAQLRAQGPVQQLINQSTAFANELMQQVEARQLNHAELRRTLPTARMSIKAGQQNPVSRYIAGQNIAFGSMDARFIATPDRGLNGAAIVRGLKADTLQLDTVYIVAFQDTARLNLRAGVVNGPQNPQYTFRVDLTGEVRSEDGDLMIEYKGEQGETGLLLGANVRPAEGGVQIQFTPEDPIVAYRRFNFNQHNQVFIRNNGRVIADVEMLDSLGMGLRVHSLPDTTYLQNLDVEIRRIELANISRLLPYYPSFSGLFSLEGTFQQTEDNMQLSAETTIGDFNFEERRVGNIGIGATWLPGSSGQHYVDAYMSLEGDQVLTASGVYQGGEQDNINVNAALDRLPLSVANAFMPEDLVELSGAVNGELAVSGALSQPLINGQIQMDSVAAYSPQYSIRLNFQNTALPIVNNRLTFDSYEVYTTGNNPFTINGFVDFLDMSNAHADISLLAQNYELLNAPRRDGALLYGRVYVDLNSTIRGPLNELVMRGNLNVLGTTNVNYVLTDSPLTVQDRLGDLVEFTSFSDTLSTADDDANALALGGLDLSMTINIDQSTEVGVDLTADRSSFVDIQGGGNLSFQYTPQGDMSLTGRYTVQQGTLKYSLPIIPLDEFAINEGSYVQWQGDVLDPQLSLRATERMRAQVSNEGENAGSRMVSFDVSIQILNSLNNLDLVFDISAPEDPEVQQQLEAMAPEERSKQAIAMMATGTYLAGGATGGSGFNMGNALNSVLQSQLVGIAGSAFKPLNITLSAESYDDMGGATRTDYNFKYSQRLFNDRVQVVVGGTISRGDNADQNQSFIDNISLEYRLDDSGGRLVRIYHNRNYESIFEGEIVETGVGLILRKKVNRLGELFIFGKGR